MRNRTNRNNHDKPMIRNYNNSNVLYSLSRDKTISINKLLPNKHLNVHTDVMLYETEMEELCFCGIEGVNEYIRKYGNFHYTDKYNHSFIDYIIKNNRYVEFKYLIKLNFKDNYNLPLSSINYPSEYFDEATLLMVLSNNEVDFLKYCRNWISKENRYSDDFYSKLLNLNINNRMIESLDLIIKSDMKTESFFLRRLITITINNNNFNKLDFLIEITKKTDTYRNEIITFLIKNKDLLRLNTYYHSHKEFIISLSKKLNVKRVYDFFSLEDKEVRREVYNMDYFEYPTIDCPKTILNPNYIEILETKNEDVLLAYMNENLINPTYKELSYFGYYNILNSKLKEDIIMELIRQLRVEHKVDIINEFYDFIIVHGTDFCNMYQMDIIDFADRIKKIDTNTNEDLYFIKELIPRLIKYNNDKISFDAFDDYLSTKEEDIKSTVGLSYAVKNENVDAVKLLVNYSDDLEIQNILRTNCNTTIRKILEDSLI